MSFASLQTTVHNPGSAARTYGYLGAHGDTLAAGETKSYDEDLLAKLSQPRKRRQLAAFKRDLAPDSGSPRIVLVGTPQQHTYDATLDMTKVVSIDNGSVVAVDPSWGEYSSSIGG